jgi:hypothetical protein
VAENSDLKLSIIITVVSGKESVRRCLAAVVPQISEIDAEIIVPFDNWCRDVADLSGEFPDVRFHFIQDVGFTVTEEIPAVQHRLYDRRRAVGLQISRGTIVALTEDHARPADDWCSQIIAAHDAPYGSIGGAIENGVDRPMNRAVYFCDFGRYGRPFSGREVGYVSDVNVSYKREVLMQIREVWSAFYHETTVHWALQNRGSKLFLDPKIVVYQERPPLHPARALRERVAWGRLFAETRAEQAGPFQRLALAAGTLLLPFLLTARVLKHMLRQKTAISKMISSLPIAFLLTFAWSLGELFGYVAGEQIGGINEAGLIQ